MTTSAILFIIWAYKKGYSRQEIINMLKDKVRSFSFKPRKTVLTVLADN